MKLFNYEYLITLAEKNAQFYQSNQPFPHVMLENVANTDVLDEVYAQFPSPQQLSWYKYDNALEKKLALNTLERLPELYRNILFEFNTGLFIRFLEKLTGIKGLIPDPFYNGGGLHQIPAGGKLDVHADYNYHPVTKLDRRINVLLYLNKNWHETYGGHLELWDVNMTQAVQRILPIFNRMVVFSTTDFSYHGHPEPLTCPSDMTRKSIALYYYSNGRPESEKTKPHSTVFKKRPQDVDDPEVAALRELRAKGRVADIQT